MSERPGWDLTWMRMARAIARRSLCDGEKVGAVITSLDNRIVAVGYNNPPTGFVHQGENCLAWCPRMQESRKIVGYEQDEKMRWTAAHQITEWGGAVDDQYVEIDNWRRFELKEMSEDEITELMKSCGFKPSYGGGSSSYANCPSLHAEANVISVCDRSQRECGTLYVTSMPCMDCAKLIANSGLWRVVYRDTPRGRERERRDESPIVFLNECNIEVTQW